MPKLKSIVVFSIILFGILLFTKISQAATYYVDGSCGSSGNGTTAVCGATGPWKTLNEAATGVPAGGNTINVAVGTYNERVSDNRNGASDGNYRWWKANGTVNMQGFASYADYWRISGFTIETVTAGDPNGFGIRVGAGSDYWLIENNTIQDSVGMGIFVWRSNHITVKNNTVMRSAEAGILSNGEYNVIQDNDISDIRNTIKGVTPAAYQADGIRVFGGYGTYKGNYIHDISYAHQTCNGIMGGCNTTYDPPHIDAFQTWGSTAEQPVVNNAVFEKNHIVLMEKAIHNNTALHGFMINGGAHDLTFKNNIFEVHNFMNSGNTGGYKPYNLYFYNNTFRSSLSFSVYPYPWADCFSFTGVTGTVEIKNNITIDFPYGHYGKDSATDATFIQKNNDIYNSDGSTPGMGGMSADATDLWKVDPKFATNYIDLHLQSTSPAKDKGVTIAAVMDDYLGIIRPQGAGWDIGAYEFIPTGDTTVPSTPTNLSATAISSSQINLSWTASTDNIGVAGYRIYRGGSQIGTSATNSYSDTGLSPSTAYSYTVAAYDAAGNVSSQSSSASATTQAATGGTNYYVSTSGSDSYNGLYATYQGGSNGPWKTLGKTASTVPNGNYTINVAAGTYAETVSDSKSGASPGYRHWKANGTVNVNFFAFTGSWVKIEGFTINGTGYINRGALDFRGGDNCYIKGNTISNVDRVGLMIYDASADGYIIEGNTITNAKGAGMWITGTNHQILNNDISDIRSTADLTDSNLITFHGSGHTFRGNYFHNFILANQYGDPHMDVFQTWGSDSTQAAAQNIIFEKNFISLVNPSTGKIEHSHSLPMPNVWMLEGVDGARRVSNITIRNNIVEAGWVLNQGGGSGRAWGTENVYIYNNVFRSDINEVYDRWPWGINLNWVTNYVIKNNIFVDFYSNHLGGTASTPPSTYTTDYNIFYNTNGNTANIASWIVLGAHDMRSVQGGAQYDPKFANPTFYGNDEYMKLLGISPAIDNGTTISSVTNDYDGIFRPQGSAYDIGAYEYTGSGDTTAPAAPSGVSIN